MNKKIDLVDIHIPLTVPQHASSLYVENYKKATGCTSRLFLFAGDQKIEHLHEDFFGEGIDPAAADPQHLFDIANQGRVGAFATQFGLIARYGRKFPSINYVVKLNSKTNLISLEHDDPLSLALVTIDQVASFAKSSGLSIVGVGYTVFLGSRYEAQMLVEAAQIVQQAHAHGLLAILWMYPRGASVKHERSVCTVTGAAGVGVCLGADFVKINVPEPQDGLSSAQLLKRVTTAAGNTKVICAGGTRKSTADLLEDIYHQIHTGNTAGAAIGRNIHQRSLHDACKMTKALAAIIMDGKDLESAKQMLSA